MAKRTNKATANGATIPPVRAMDTAPVVPVTTPLAVGAPVAPNTTTTSPPAGDNVIADFIGRNATSQAAGKLGQALLAREIGRWAFDGVLKEDKLGDIVVMSVKATALALGKDEPAGAAIDPKGTAIKGLVSKFRQCLRVGALPGIGRAAIDGCYEYAFHHGDDRLFPMMVSAARVQRDNYKTDGLLSDERFAALLAKVDKTPTEDEQRLENLRRIRGAINTALGFGVEDVAKMPPALSDEAIIKLNEFRDGPLADMFRALNAGTTEADDKLKKEIEDGKRAIAAKEKAFSERMGRLAN